MKVILGYSIKIEKEIEITPEKYCELHASFQGYFPENSYNQNIKIANEESENELQNFLFRKRKK